MPSTIDPFHCLDCSAPLDLEESAEAITEHGIPLCESCVADRRQEDKADLALKDL